MENKAGPGELFAATFPKGCEVVIKTLFPSEHTMVIVKKPLEPPRKVKRPIDAKP